VGGAGSRRRYRRPAAGGGLNPPLSSGPVACDIRFEASAGLGARRNGRDKET